MAIKHTAEPAVKEAAKEVAVPKKSASVAFVGPLGDPSNPDNTKRGEQVVQTSTIVGYKFKALEDLKVPDCGVPSNLKKNLMDPGTKEEWVEVKKGQEFKLTIFETALLISQPEYGGKFTGGEIPVVAVYVFPTSAKDGDVTIAQTKEPRVNLRAEQNGQSIKNFDIEPVLECVRTVGEKNRVSKERTLLPGFEKWESLCKKGIRKSSGRAAAKKEDKTAQNAARFLHYTRTRKANAAKEA